MTSSSASLPAYLPPRSPPPDRFGLLLLLLLTVLSLRRARRYRHRPRAQIDGEGHLLPAGRHVFHAPVMKYLSQSHSTEEHVQAATLHRIIVPQVRPPRAVRARNARIPCERQAVRAKDRRPVHEIGAVRTRRARGPCETDARESAPRARARFEHCEGRAYGGRMAGYEVC